VLTLDTEKSFRANAMLPQLVRLVVKQEFVTELLKQLVVLLSTAAPSSVLALQSAFVDNL